MDPTSFQINWEQLFQALAVVVVLSFLVERALALLFEHRLYVSRFSEKGFKEPIAFVLATFACWHWDFDMVAILFNSDSATLVGKLLTGAVIAGGSKASIKLFKDIMGVQSEAAKASKAVKAPAR